MARPTKYTTERADKVTQALKAGNTRKASAAYAGIDYRTLLRWEGRFVSFALSIARAEADAEVMNVAIIQQAARPHDVVSIKETLSPDGTVRRETTTKREFDWHAAAWWLERRRYQDWRQRKSLDVSDLSKEQLIALLEDDLDDESDETGNDVPAVDEDPIEDFDAGNAFGL